MDLEELLSYKKRVEKTLAAELKNEGRAASKISPRLTPFTDATEEYTLRGGKRFRALLLLAGYHLAGGKNLAVPLPAAAALETFQSWMLIHDDVIDHSETRRGGPSMHVKMAEFHVDQELSGADTDFGSAAAITLGDLMETLTVRLLLSVKVPDARRTALLQEYVQMTRLTALGQMLDIYFGTLPVGRVTEKDVLAVHRLKSAAYSVSSPLRLGAILGGASPRFLEKLGEAGDLLGTAFQLRDDILGLGITGDDVGKPTNDLFEGKRTLLVVHAWNHASRPERLALEKVLGNPLSTPRDLDHALDVIRDTGSLEYSEERIAQLREKALRSLKGLPKDKFHLLSQIATLLTDRRI